MNHLNRIRQAFTSANLALIGGVLACACISIFTLWYSSAGNFPHLPYTGNGYVDLGEAFLHGQLSLLEKPSPELMALQNPYDSAQRTMLYYWDASLYKGQYYLYWGPTPALIFAVVEGITRIRPPGSLLVILSYIGLPIIFFVILYQLWKRFFPNTPAFSVGLGVLVGFVNLPFLFLLGRPIIYETSIIIGQFFIFLGLLGWLMYSLVEDKYRWLPLAGFSWGLAIGSRYNLAISIIIYLAFALAQLIRNNRLGRELWVRIACLCAPVVLCLVALAGYNFARFGNLFEVGLSYILTIPEARVESFYSLSYLLSNLFIYLFYPMTTSDSFPFVITNLPIGNQFDEVVAGLLPSTPILWLATLIIPAIILAGRFPRAQRELPLPVSLKPFLYMIMTAASAQFLFLLVFFFVAMRYLADFYLPLILGIWILLWHLDNQIQSLATLRLLFWLAVVVLAIWTTGIGFFSSFDFPSQIFRDSNPDLYASLESYWNNRSALFRPFAP